MPQTNLQTPPVGNQQEAEKYVSKITELIAQGKLKAIHTDLSKYDPSSIRDHYRIDLIDYQIEVSHSKNPDNGTDSYVMLFNTLQSVRDNCTEKVILAFLNLTAEQFKKVKDVSDEQIETLKYQQLEKQFSDAIIPIEQALQTVSDPNYTPPVEEEVKEKLAEPEEITELAVDKKEEPAPQVVEATQPSSVEEIAPPPTPSAPISESTPVTENPVTTPPAPIQTEPAVATQVAPQTTSEKPLDGYNLNATSPTPTGSETNLLNSNGISSVPESQANNPQPTAPSQNLAPLPQMHTLPLGSN